MAKGLRRSSAGNLRVTAREHTIVLLAFVCEERYLRLEARKATEFLQQSFTTHVEGRRGNRVCMHTDYLYFLRGTCILIHCCCKVQHKSLSQSLDGAQKWAVLLNSYLDKQFTTTVWKLAVAYRQLVSHLPGEAGACLVKGNFGSGSQ